MAAFNSDYPPFDSGKAIFAEGVLLEIADLRAHGKTWEETAKAVEWDANELSRAALHDPNFEPALERARDRVADETNDEGLAQLRELAKSGKPETALQAHQIIRKYLAEQQRNKTRLAAERMRLQAALARAGAKSAKAEREAQKQAEEEARTQQEDEEFARRSEEAREECERRSAERLAREEAIVYLWGGYHKIGDTPPDETDTPLYLTADHTVRGRMLYWVLKRPLDTDPFNGPFPSPPGSPAC